MSEAQWFLVHTQPRGEFRAQDHLRRQDFEAYMPVEIRIRRHARKVYKVKSPFFPRYLFVRLDLSIHRWRSINGTVGVHRLVMVGDTPQAIPVGIVESVKQRENNDGYIEVRRFSFNPGDQVVIKSGPFDGIGAIFEAMSADDRIKVLIDLLGRKVRVAVDAAYIESA